MRIAFIGDGGSIHNRFMLSWFIQRGHEVLFLTDTPDPEIQCETIQVVPRHGGGPLRHVLAGYRVYRILKDWKPDLVHAHNVTGYGYWGALSGFSPLVMTAWGSDLNILAQENPVVRLLARFCLVRSSLITADAIALCRTAREIAEREIDVRLLQWGVDLGDYDRTIQNSILPASWPSSDFIFISTRRLRTVYNIEVILKAFHRMVKEVPQARLVVVGQDLMRDELEQLSRDLSIADRVCFTGWVERQTMLDLLCQANAFISVPSSDSTALSLLEAFAARLPVIVSDLPANHEWVTPGDNGYLVYPEDVEDLADKMKNLAQNRNHAYQCGLRNRSIVEERGDREKEMRKLEVWYQEILEKSS